MIGDEVALVTVVALPGFDQIAHPHRTTSLSHVKGFLERGRLSLRARRRETRWHATRVGWHAVCGQRTRTARSLIQRCLLTFELVSTRLRAIRTAMPRSGKRPLISEPFRNTVSMSRLLRPSRAAHHRQLWTRIGRDCCTIR